MNKKKQLVKATKKNIKQDKGQSILEYLILTTLVGMVCLAAVKEFGSKIEHRIKEVKKGVVREIKF
jgi:cytochrome c biogenesis protein ResB